MAVLKPGHVGPVTEEEKAEIAEEVAKEVHDVGLKDEISDEVTATVKVGDAMSKASADAEEISNEYGKPPPPGMAGYGGSPPPGPMFTGYGASPPPGPVLGTGYGASPPPGPSTLSEAFGSVN